MKKLLFILFSSILFSCSEDLGQPYVNIESEEMAVTKSVSDFKESKFGLPMVLGEKLQNPYSIKSLQRASSKEKSIIGFTIQETDITPTHYYVRFFPFPLDHKIIEGGSFYRDPDPANVGKLFSW